MAESVVERDKLRKFIPFAKVDEATRQVWGIVTAEVPDKEDEVCDYEGTKPFYQALIDEMSKASKANPDGGDNFFPLREMHGLTAAGKCVGFEFRDQDREIFMGFKVVDDAAWKKVKENVYTGFSQGGRKVGDMKPDPVYKGCMRYIANPSEASLVDNPCLSVAHFTYVKTDGSVELRKFSKTEPVPSNGELAKTVATLQQEVALLKAAAPTVAKGKTKRVDGEDLPSSAFAFVGDKEDTSTWKLPIKFSTDKKTKSHIKNALARFNQTEGIPEGEKSKVHSRIVSAAKQHGIDVDKEKAKFAAIQGFLRKQCRRSVNKFERSLGTTGDIGHTLSFLDSDLSKLIKGIATTRKDLAKGLYTVSAMAAAIQDLSWLVYSVCNEEEYEGDEDSPLPEMLANNIGGLLDTLTRMVQEESQELREEVGRRVAV